MSHTLMSSPHSRYTINSETITDNDLSPTNNRNDTVKSRTVYFCPEGNKYGKTFRLAIHPKIYKNMDVLLSDLTKKMPELSYGVRTIFTPKGRDKVYSLDDLNADGKYLCSENQKRAKRVNITYGPLPPWRSVGKQIAASNTFHSQSNIPINKSSNNSDNWATPGAPAIRLLGTISSETTIYGNQDGIVDLDSPSNSRTKKIYVLIPEQGPDRNILLINKRAVSSYESFVKELCAMFSSPHYALYDDAYTKVDSLSAVFNGTSYFLLLDENLADGLLVNKEFAEKPVANQNGQTNGVTKKQPSKQLPSVNEKRPMKPTNSKDAWKTGNSKSIQKIDKNLDSGKRGATFNNSNKENPTEEPDSQMQEQNSNMGDQNYKTTTLQNNDQNVMKDQVKNSFYNDTVAESEIANSNLTENQNANLEKEDQLAKMEVDQSVKINDQTEEISKIEDTKNEILPLDNVNLETQNIDENDQKYQVDNSDITSETQNADKNNQNYSQEDVDPEPQLMNFDNNQIVEIRQSDILVVENSDSVAQFIIEGMIDNAVIGNQTGNQETMNLTQELDSKDQENNDSEIPSQNA